jgi:SAM-dependent methyltransferase
MNADNQVEYWLQHFEQQAERHSTEHKALDFSNEDTMSQIHDIVVDAFGGNIQDGATVLDVGCGSGRVFAELCGAVNNKSLTLVGIDLSKNLLSHARRRVGEVLPDSWTATFLQANLLQLAMAEATADVTVCIEALQHMNPQDGIISLLDTTSSGGKVVVSVPNAENTIIKNAVQRNDGRYHGVAFDRFVERIRAHSPNTTIEVLPLVFREDQSEQPFYEPDAVPAESYTPSARPNRYIIQIDL